MWATAEMAEEEACEVGVHTLITADELVAEGEARHEPSLLEPEDGSEGPGEENALDGGERDEALSERRTLVRDPLEGPVGLLLYARDRLDRVEQVLAFGGILDVCVN